MESGQEPRLSQDVESGAETGSGETPQPWYLKYPDLTEEEDTRSLLGIFQKLSPEDRIQSAANIANLFGNAIRKGPSAVIPFSPDKILSRLTAHRLDFILVGGLAGITHGYSGGTNDVDIVVPQNDETIQRLMNFLQAEKVQLRISEPPYGVNIEWNDPELFRLREVVNLMTEYGPCNILFSATGIGNYEDILPRSEIWVIGGLNIRIAHLQAIIDSKEAANRPKDRSTLPVYYQLRDQLESTRN